MTLCQTLPVAERLGKYTGHFISTYTRYVQKASKQKLHLLRQKWTMNERLIFLRIAPFEFNIIPASFFICQSTSETPFLYMVRSWGIVFISMLSTSSNLIQLSVELIRKYCVKLAEYEEHGTCTILCFAQNNSFKMNRDWFQNYFLNSNRLVSTKSRWLNMTLLYKFFHCTYERFSWAEKFRGGKVHMVTSYPVIDFVNKRDPNTVFPMEEVCEPQRIETCWKTNLIPWEYLYQL